MVFSSCKKLCWVFLLMDSYLCPFLPYTVDSSEGVRYWSFAMEDLGLSL